MCFIWYFCVSNVLTKHNAGKQWSLFTHCTMFVAKKVFFVRLLPPKLLLKSIHFNSEERG